jgi:hypothetical protein
VVGAVSFLRHLGEGIVVGARLLDIELVGAKDARIIPT